MEPHPTSWYRSLESPLPADFCLPHERRPTPTNNEYERTRVSPFPTTRKSSTPVWHDASSYTAVPSPEVLLPPKQKFASQSRNGGGGEGKNLIPSISPADVLFGRGCIAVYPGNVHFRQVIKLHRLNYINGRRHEKQSIVELVMEEIRSRGGRFCKRYNQTCWEVVDDKTARRKTSQALREGAPELRQRRRHHDVDDCILNMAENDNM